MAPPDLKKLLQVRIKPRHDSYSDQFSRILMVKMLMMTAAITGITWMKDKIICIVPKNHDLSDGFVSKACWINGLYIYRNLKPEDESYYYGIPRDISNDGVNKYGSMCSSDNGGSCTELVKTFFLQYQWFPLAVAALSFLYYLPYLLFRVVNSDMLQVKEKVKNKKVADVKFDYLLETFFSDKSSSVSHLRARVLLNVFVKVLYVIVNVVGLLVIDSSLNGQFIAYGGSWANWSGLSNYNMHDYINREAPKAGHHLLPGFGLCQVQSSGQDIKNKVINEHTYICELSQHVLYQYILIVMWYMFIFGIIVAIVGLLKHVYNQVMMVMNVNHQEDDVKRVYKHLTSRQVEYMEFVRRKNMPVFGVLLRQVAELKQQELSPPDSIRSSYNPYQQENKNVQ